MKQNMEQKQKGWLFDCYFKRVLRSDVFAFTKAGPSIVERLFIKALCSSQVRGCGLPGSPAAIVSGSAGINAALQLASQYYSDLFWPFRALGPPKQELFPSSWRDRQPLPPSLSSIFRTHAASLWMHINPPLAPQSFIKNGLIFELP